MSIHHATRTRAEKFGIILEEVDGGVVAINHQYGVRVGPIPDAKNALMACVLRVEQRQKEEYEGKDTVDVTVASGASGEGTQEEAVGRPKSRERAAEKATDENVERSEGGVPLDGGVAYHEGFSAADNPYSTETENDEEYNAAVAWDEAWDDAADAADEEKPTGSVVNEKYRAIYAELGHPEHCGDWLATVFNNLVKIKTGTDIGMVDAIAEANGVDNSKYDRTRPGWQGRLRMTTRNLLARVVWLNDGVMRVPDADGVTEFKAPADWMSKQRFKKPKIKAEPESTTK